MSKSDISVGTRKDECASVNIQSDSGKQRYYLLWIIATIWEETKVELLFNSQNPSKPHLKIETFYGERNRNKTGNEQQ